MRYEDIRVIDDFTLNSYLRLILRKPGSTASIQVFQDMIRVRAFKNQAK